MLVPCFLVLITFNELKLSDLLYICLNFVAKLIKSLETKRTNNNMTRLCINQWSNGIFLVEIHYEIQTTPF